MSLIKGQIIRLTLTEGDQYEGTLQHVNDTTGRLTLYGVKDLSTGLIFNALHYYTRTEIRDIEIIQQPKVKLKKADVSKVIPPAEVYDAFKEVTEFAFNLPKDELERLEYLKNNVIYLSRVNNKFQEVIDELNNCETLAIDAKNVEQGRNSEMSLLIIASWCTVYVFDIKLLGLTAFTSGIRDLFESELILKIFHNGVKIVDCLKHHYQVTTLNIADTQILDVIIRYKATKQDLVLKKSLGECLTLYLNAPQNFIDETNYFPKWNERPVNEMLRRKVGEQVAYLITLYNCMQKQLHSDFYEKVDRFMNAMSTLDPGKAFYVVTRPDYMIREMEKLSVNDREIESSSTLTSSLPSSTYQIQ